jgi:hypothetical protein
MKRFLAFSLVLAGTALLAASCADLLGGIGTSITATNLAPQVPAGTIATTLELSTDDGSAWSTDTRDLGVNGNANTWYKITLPAAPADFQPGNIWGNNPYTSDSPLGTAALHAGAITTAGGVIYIKVIAGRSNYYASTSTGVTSTEYGSWGSSYAIYKP